MAPPPGDSVFTGPPDAGRRARTLGLMALLARPALDAAGRDALRAMVAAADWLLVPPVPGAAPLGPLMRHHAETAGLSWEQIFEMSAAAVPGDFGALAMAHYERRRLLGRLGIAVASVAPGALAIKGAAVAPMYATPALRAMVDFDLVLRDDPGPTLDAALGGEGWAPVVAGQRTVWRHAGGMLLDVHCCRGDVADAIAARAVPHADAATGLRVPHPDDHLAIVALHAVRDAGARLWRDVCDARALLASGATFDGAHRRAAALGPAATRAVAAFAWFVGKTDAEPAAPPPAPDELAWLMDAMACEPAPPTALNLLRGRALETTRLLAPLRRVALEWMPTDDAPGPRPTENDPILGLLPPPGTPEREALRSRLAADAAASPGAAHYRRLLAAQETAAATPKVFAGVG